MEDSSGTTSDMKIEDFMDVIMAYKCKFCEVTCSTAQQMSVHIKQVHIFPVGLQQDLHHNSKEIQEQETAPTTFVEEKALQESETMVTINSKTTAHDCEVTNPISATSGIPIDTPDTFKNSQPLPTVSDVQQIDIPHGNNDGLVSGGEQYTLTSSSNMAPNSQLTTKLLYVCGQCSVGFNSIDDCKEHMIESHGQSETNMEIEELDATSTHVSVGTQMEPKKKPGRKKKSEIKKEIVTSEESDEEDKDWVPENPTGRSRRKIRPPRALKEDYYINNTKKKKSKKRQTMNNKELKHKCYLYGCLARFSTKENLDIHVASHNTSNDGFTCTECQQNFDAWRLLRMHLHRKHEIDLDLATCEICGFKVDTMNKMRVHKEIHSDSRPYTCDICGKGFRQYSQMKNHQIVHDEYQKSEDQSMQCPTCQRTFVNKKCLLKHQQQVHTDVKNFKCTMCTYATTRKAMLTLHLRVHTGEKPYKCDLCAYASSDHNSLRRHKMRHTGQKQYKCNYCPYSCIQAVSLKSHLRKKHPGCEGNFICEDCNFQSVSKHAYELHLQDHKNGRIVNRQKPERAKSSMLTQTDTAEGEYLSIAGNAESTQVKMLVQTMKSGEAQVSAEDLAKLSCYEGLMTGEMSAAQLIYSALSAIGQSEKSGVPQTAELLGGVQCTTLSSENEEGVTSHTITFHLPANVQNAQPQESETVLFGQPVEIIETVDESAVRFIESSISEETTTDADGNIVIRGIVVGQDEQEESQMETETNYEHIQDGQQSFIVIGEASEKSSGQVYVQSTNASQDSFQTEDAFKQSESISQVIYQQPARVSQDGCQELEVASEGFQQSEVQGSEVDAFQQLEDVSKAQDEFKQQKVATHDGFQQSDGNIQDKIQQPEMVTQDAYQHSLTGTEEVMDSSGAAETNVTANTSEKEYVNNESIPNQIITINLHQINP